MESSVFDLREVSRWVRNLLPREGKPQSFLFTLQVQLLTKSCWFHFLHASQLSCTPLTFLPCYSCPRWQHLRWPLSLSSLPLTSVFCLNELFLKFRSDHNIVLSSGLLVPFASLTAYRSKLNSRRGPHETPRSRAPLLSVQF